MALNYLFYYLIFPGFLFASIVGIMMSFLDRKITARLQYRVGPPWYQNFVDLLKLFNKEVIVPRESVTAFVLAPFLGLISAVLVSAMLGRALMNTQAQFVGDLIVVVYLLVVPSLSLIIGASLSANPLASVGASRELKLVLAYELPFLLSIIIVIIKTASIRLGDIVSFQLAQGSIAGSWSGAIGFIITIFCIQAKLGFVPFDMAEAEQEIMGGTLIEYSGPLLGIFRLTRFVLLYSLALFIVVLFLAGSLNWLLIVLKYLLILTLIILIKNTNPRLRIDQALNFFWKLLTPLALVGIIIAFLGY